MPLNRGALGPDRVQSSSDSIEPVVANARRQQPGGVMDRTTFLGAIPLGQSLFAGFQGLLLLLTGVYWESSAPASKCSRTWDLSAVGCLTYVFCFPRSSKPSVLANSC